jgi:hypothetical protein
VAGVSEKPLRRNGQSGRSHRRCRDAERAGKQPFAFGFLLRAEYLPFGKATGAELGDASGGSGAGCEPHCGQTSPSLNVGYRSSSTAGTWRSAARQCRANASAVICCWRGQNWM